jgi:hypothetical protein
LIGLSALRSSGIRNGSAAPGFSAVLACGALLSNGELLDAAERKGFALMVTTDSNLPYEQNLGDQRLAIVVLPSTNRLRIQQVIAVGLII